MNLWKYIQGDRKGKEAHRIEREALKDPFLQEALEGFDKVDGNHAERIEALQQQIMAASRPKQHLFAKWSIAASILLLISIGGYLFIIDDRGKDKMLVAEQIQDIGIQKDVPISEETERAKFVEEEITAQLPIAKADQREQKRKESIQVESEISLRSVEGELFLADELIQIDTVIFLPMDELNALAEAKQTISEQDSVFRIQGQITDNNGEPLVGASIIQKGTSYGSISDINGMFSLTIEEPEGLTVQYIGYETLEIPAVQISSSMNIALHESTSSLEEVVVAGYGQQRKQSFTGSVTTVKDSEPVIGWTAYENYLKENQIHLVDESGELINGTVKLSFSVDKQGRPENITIEKGLDESANKEAVRLVREGPDWIWSEKKVDVTVYF